MHVCVLAKAETGEAARRGVARTSPPVLDQNVLPSPSSAYFGSAV